MAVKTVIGLLDVVTVSNSAKFKSFLLISAPTHRSPQQLLSSGLIVDGEGRHQFSESEKNVVLCFSFNFRIHLALFHAASWAYRCCLSLLETDPQILEHWGYADEDHLANHSKRWYFGLECQHDATRLW